jgi:hypothetical protein
MPDNTTIIKIHLRKVIAILVVTAFSLITLNCLTWYLDRHTDIPMDVWVRLFSVNREANLPTTFSIFLLVISTSLLAIIAIESKNHKEPFSAAWISLTIIFGYITIDEASALHEMTDPFLNQLLGSGPFGIFTHSWVWLPIFLIPLLVILFAKFYLQLPKFTRTWTGIAGFIYILGAAGMEMVGSSVIAVTSANHRYYFLAYTLEESLEMLGIILFIYALMAHLSLSDSAASFKIIKTAAQE